MAPRGAAGLSGPRAARLIRALVDVAPPYSAKQLTQLSGLTAGYVSRLLQTLENEVLIERPGREIVTVDVAGVLRAWAESYDLLRSNRAHRFVAPEGPDVALSRLAAGSEAGEVTVTGSFAAVRLAPVAGPALLAAYTRDVQATAAGLGLLPTDAGANVMLLEPFDPIALARAEVVDGIPYAAPSQVVVDCLTGPGRMPTEGVALLEWMTTDESLWRLPSVAAALMGNDGS